MPRNRKKVEAGLLSKGFRQTEGDHHFFVYFTVDGRKSLARTKTSHGMQEIPDRLLAQMARQCKINRVQFIDLIDCPLGRTDYERLLQANGGI